MKRNVLKILVLMTVTISLLMVASGAYTADETKKGKAADDPKEKERLSTAIATVDGKPITVEYIETILAKQSPMMRKSLEDETKRKDFLDKIVNMELLALEAKKRGFDKHDEVTSVAKNQLASLMHREIADSIEDPEPSEEDMRKYYEENITRYKKPEKVRVRHILMPDKDEAEKQLAEIKKKKISQHDFRRLAQEHSKDEDTRLRGGDLSFFTRLEDRKEGDPEIDPAIVEAAFKLEKNGDVYPKLVKTDKGYHILMRTGHRDKMDVSFEDAKGRLTTLVQRNLRKDSVENSVNELKTRFSTEVFEENLKYVVIDLSMGPPEPDAKGGLTSRERKERRSRMVPGGKGKHPMAPPRKKPAAE